MHKKPKYKEYKHNPRIITSDQKESLEDTLRRLGDLSGIIFNKKSKEFIGGNQRSKVIDFDNCEIEIVKKFKKPTKQGTTAIGFVLWEGERYNYREVSWDEKTEKEANIVANKAGGDFDFKILKEHFEKEDLIDWGFEEGELWEDDKDPKEGEVVIPKVIKTDIVRGDLFEFVKGDLRHRLLCGDSTNADDVEKLMGGEKADMVFTDPPYNINYGKHPKSKQREIQNDNMSSLDFRDFCIGFATSISMTTDGIIYCAGPPGEDGRIMFTVLDEMFHCSTTIVWNKDQFILGRGKYQNKYEPIWFGWNKNGSTFTEDRTLPNVWDIDRPKKSELHPTMKPLEICSTAIKHSSSVGHSVLDLFNGSGSTMVSSHENGRNCYGMEIDPRYVQVGIDRMLRLDESIQLIKNGKDVTKKYRGRLKSNPKD